MAIENAHRNTVNLRLNGGTRPGGGGMLVRTTPLGRLMHGADNAKIMSVIGALVPVLKHPLFRVEKTVVTILEN